MNNTNVVVGTVDEEYRMTLDDGSSIKEAVEFLLDDFQFSNRVGIVYSKVKDITGSLGYFIFHNNRLDIII